jgi:hypothetical protein
MKTNTLTISWKRKNFVFKNFGGNMEEKKIKRVQGKSPEPLLFLGG